MTVGSHEPVVGVALDVGEGENFGDGKGVGVGTNEAEGVASPSTEVPLFKILKATA